MADESECSDVTSYQSEFDDQSKSYHFDFSNDSPIKIRKILILSTTISILY